MNQFICTLIISLSLSLKLFAQSCPTSDIYFTKQSEINTFRRLYPDCKEIPKSVYISESSIANLDSLVNIETIKGDLKIGNADALTNVNGLRNLKSIGQTPLGGL